MRVPGSASSATSPATWATAGRRKILKRQIAIFREVSEDIATRLEKTTGLKGYDGIANVSHTYPHYLPSATHTNPSPQLRFNGTHNGMAAKDNVKVANGMSQKVGKTTHHNYNGAPVSGTHRKESIDKTRVNGDGVSTNGH